MVIECGLSNEDYVHFEVFSNPNCSRLIDAPRIGGRPTYDNTPTLKSAVVFRVMN